MQIGFWNTKRKSFTNHIVDFVYAKKVDILILAECTVSLSQLQADIQQNKSKFKYIGVSKNAHPKFKILVKPTVTFVDNFDLPGFMGESWSINKFHSTAIGDFSIVSVHFPSKLEWDDHSQTFEAINLMNKIRNYEVTHGKNTILIGDFNMNPYELGMFSSVGIHGIKDEHTARKKKRRILGEYYDFLYNPMWNYLGDENAAPGTYFYRKAVHTNVMWNTFDQILFRPDFLKYKRKVEVVTKIGSINLVNPTSKRIYAKYSDHLPILASIKP